MPQAQYCSITLAAERYLRHRYLALACGILGYLAKGRPCGRTIHNTYLIQQYNTIRIIQQYARQATPAAVYNTVTVLGVKYTSDKVGGPNTPKYTTVVDLFCGPQIHKIHSEFSPTPNTQNTDITPRVTVVTSAVASRHGPGAAGPGRGRAPAAGRGRAPAAAAAPAPQRSCARAHSLPHHI